MSLSERLPLAFAEPISGKREALAARSVARHYVQTQSAEDRATILVADADGPARSAIAQMMTQQGYNVMCAGSASDMESWLHQKAFDVLISDLRLYGPGRADLLNRLSDKFPETRLILTAEPEEAGIAAQKAREHGIDFIAKPWKPAELTILVQRALMQRNLQQKHSQKFRMAFDPSLESALDAMISALNTRDTEAPGHSERVTAYTMELAAALGMPASQRYHVERGALLHDIGKVGISDRVLRKPGALTEEEWTEVRQHPVLGYRMCEKIEMLRPASQIVRHHHERWDGGGYPDGLAGQAIPIGARIFAIADALDAMTTDRPYRAALSPEVAWKEIGRCAGKQFDPELVRVFQSISPERLAEIQAIAAR